MEQTKLNSGNLQISVGSLYEFFNGVINTGDTIMMHSSLSAIGWFKEGPKAVVDAFLEMVGPQGNLIMPSPTTSFSKTHFFDVRNTPSEAGLLSEVFRKKVGVRRSCVPMASFVAFGANSKDFTNKYNSYLDTDSPFTKLFAKNGKVILFGVDYNKCTIYHLSEERMKVESDHYMTFDGTIVDWDGNSYTGGQRYFVRKDLNTRKDARMVGMLFEGEGGVVKRRFGGGLVRTFIAKDFDDYCMDVLEKNRHVFLKCYDDDSLFI